MNPDPEGYWFYVFLAYLNFLLYPALVLAVIWAVFYSFRRARKTQQYIENDIEHKAQSLDALHKEIEELRIQNTLLERIAIALERQAHRDKTSAD